jgi:hypothetical protein
MRCPEAGCHSNRIRTLSVAEIARVGRLPPSGHDVVFDLPCVCEDCGSVFIEGVVEKKFPLMVKLGQLRPPAKIIPFAMTS